MNLATDETPRCRSAIQDGARVVQCEWQPHDGVDHQYTDHYEDPEDGTARISRHVMKWQHDLAATA